jgi:hypothetical protein
MLNPFLQPVPAKKQAHPQNDRDELTATLYGHSLDTAVPQANVGLWVGKLLIRMGEKLANEDIQSKKSAENA